MATEFRFGAFVRETTPQQARLPYSEVILKSERDEYGAVLPLASRRIAIRPIDAYRLIRPYVSTRLMEQVRAVVPLALYLVLFQLFVLHAQIQDAGIITAGLVAVIIGLMFFMEGLKVGLMPFGQALGTTLPAKAHLHLVLLIAFLLGIGVTFAEPAIGALKAAGQIVQVESAPYLYALLNQWTDALVLGVGIGVGAAAVIGTLRFLYGWSLKPLIYLTLIPTIGLTLYILADPELNKMLGLAWDCGAVTTGPVTVPLVLSLGIGIAASTGKGQSSLSGFGIVTLASLFPIIGVQILAIYVSLVTTPEEIIAAATTVTVTTAIPWYEQTPWVEIIAGLRAIVPLVLFLYLVMRLVLREPLRQRGQIAYGIILAVLGMIIFNLGLTYGLSMLGAQTGSMVPASFTEMEHLLETPLYPWGLGIGIAFLFAWLLGFGATLAEPALNALGLTVETLTNGAFQKSSLMKSVSLGVGFGLALGVAKIIFGFSIAWLLVPGYTLAVILTWFSTEEFVNIAWDSAGVTTGPVTVPLVLAMGLGFGNAMGAIEGFGILAMASICPILSVLITGLWIQWKIKTKRRKYDESMQASQPEEACP
jgi:hypothetical protein